MNGKEHLALKREEQDQLREITEQGTVHSDGNEPWKEFSTVECEQEELQE